MTENTEDKPDYEERFAHRFSADDAIYQVYRSRPADPPPIVENWSSRGRDHRHRGGGGRGGGGGGHGWHGDRGWGGDRGWRGDRGWGGDHRRQQDRRGHESGHQSGHQGYNPYNQRPYHSY
ncbi:RNA guanine-N7 methyltransferase activating subunit [Gadus morhua]|uniref:RNA guanine-7 methyltransferase activating subunit n=1 Tax=Gadus morhua TaxID=8049 RepID=A0A8C5CGL8_GADMO|nr:RNA guanine-N7 methyltransferase activating subunit [Gadus morhua]